MSQLDKWMVGGKISKLVIVITDKDTGEHVERWQFDVRDPSPLKQPLTLTSSGPNLPTDQAVQVENTHSKRPGEHILSSIRAAPGQDGGRDPVRDRRHLPPDHRVRDVPAPAQRRLHLQRARVRRRRLGCACRMGGLGRQGDRERGEGAAARVQHGEPSGRHDREL